ncbi:MAG: TRAP transporter substrate-binding protein [Defluviitaleaceae bacterium]|nr:TRAP transporter substrate-binding protein [Defluviitaleaceae bacterium]
MKKFFKVVPVLLLIIALLVACGSGGATTGEIPPPPPRATLPPTAPTPTPAPATGGGATDTPAVDVITLSFSHNTNTGHPRGYMVERFAELVAARSDGRLVINIFPNSQLGSDGEVVEQVMQGTIDIASIFSPNVTSVVPELALFDLPYLFFTMEQAHNALDGTLGDYLSDAMAEQDLVSLGYLTSGFKDFTNNVRPIYSVQDLDGLRMRVSQSHFLVAQFQAMNAGGISIPWGEVYGAFAAGLADGQENPLATIVAASIYEVQDYITISNHGFTVYPIFMSTEVYNQLPADLRVILRESIAEIQPRQWNMIVEVADGHLEYLYSTGANINYLSDAARQDFRAFMQVIYDEFAELPNGAELLSVVGRYVS